MRFGERSVKLLYWKVMYRSLGNIGLKILSFDAQLEGRIIRAPTVIHPFMSAITIFMS